MSKEALKQAILRHKGTTRPDDLRAAILMQVEESVKQTLASMSDILVKEVRDAADAKVETFLKAKLKGDPGHTPTAEELLKLIRPLVPQQVTKAQLLDLITPLIPKVKDGLTPTREEILAIIMPLIPKVEDGEDGDDGSPDTPDQVVDKVVASKKKIPLSKIDGFDATIKKINDGIRNISRSTGGKGGGGMGNPQHEQFVVTSATTAITTAFRIAAGGYAIMSASYNDGTIMRGKDFSVGTDQKTITLLFTPDDPTPGQQNIINMVYIRT